MSCNGCRVLRKACSEACVLRHCLTCIDSPEAQAHATLFVTKFFGRAGLSSFVNGVSESQRPALFQSLLYEACGRTVNPVYGAVGLLFSGNWAVCQSAVETVLRGGSPRPAAVDCISTGRGKPNSTAMALGHDPAPAGSIPTAYHPSCFSTFMNSSSVSKHIMPESSSITSACSLKADAFPALASRSCVLDFSAYSGSSRADQWLIKRRQLSKRSRDCGLETSIDEDDAAALIKRPKSGFLYREADAAVTTDHACDAAALKSNCPSNCTWVAGYGKANCRANYCNNPVINHDVHATVEKGMQQVVPGDHATTSSLTVRQGPHQQLIAPVARRVYIPPHMKPWGELVPTKNLTGHDHQLQQDDQPLTADPRSSRKQCAIAAFSCSVHQDTTQLYKSGAGGSNMIKLDLSLQAQPRTDQCCNGGDLIDGPPPDQARELSKHEKPHVLLRLSSPSVNSEGSVNTVGRCLDTTSCSPFESPNQGVKLLNLLL